eukprot:135148_1
MTDLTRTLIWQQIAGCGFGFYTPEEIRRMSVKRVTCAQSFDSVGLAISGGFYDPVFGVGDRFESCKTCGQRQTACPGHMGHIELQFPVFNPLLLRSLTQVVKMICSHCKRWKMARYLPELYTEKLRLAEQGKVLEAMCLTANTRDVSKDDIFLEAAKMNTERWKQLQGEKNTHSQIQQCIDMILNDFWRLSIPEKCKSCSMYSPKIRREGHTTLVLEEYSEELKEKNVKSLQKVAKADKKKSQNSSDSDEKDSGSMSDIEENVENYRVEGTILVPAEIQSTLATFERHEGDTVSIVWRKIHQLHGLSDDKKAPDWSIFFVSTIAVPPIRYRPVNRVGGMVLENMQVVSLRRILETNDEMIKKSRETLAKPAADEKKSEEDGEEDENVNKLAELRTLWIQLQGHYNTLIDSNQGGKMEQEMNNGIKQLLEKKQGLFRKHMMGKRVNYAARSVVSPDLWIHSTEIGVPVVFARKLTYPEPVTPFNVKKMRQAVINGAYKYPGANHVEDEHGNLVDLSGRSLAQREALADTLLTGAVDSAQSSKSKSKGHRGGNKRVFRHLRDGDYCIMNRQPTLHKASMMTHRAKVLYGAQVLRLHYANCNAYNADFDGDEINLHLPQNELARCEAMTLSDTAHQYVTPKDGSPLRGIVQDHVCGGLLLSKRDTFFTREEYFQYIYATVVGTDDKKITRITTLPPTILKPKPLWTGKQILSTLLDHISGTNPKLNLDSTTQTPERAWDLPASDPWESIVTIRNNQWLTGVCDKRQMGAKAHGVVHAVNELYGNYASDDLLTKFGRLFTTFLQDYGFSAGVSDLVLVHEAEVIRERLRRSVDRDSVKTGAEFAGIEDYSRSKFADDDVVKLVRDKLKLPNGEAAFDSTMKNFLNPVTSEIFESAFPHGLKVKFPHNYFAAMILSGAKGSRVNISQISSLLGQQELEGKRVPRMVSGKTLPCFSPYDLSARAGGYIADRFLTGIRPQEYYFHCMAGREGLVDTAVKTANSGYLQRCLVKNMESLQVHYDYSVRDSDGSIVQFFYGEDAIDTSKTSYLSNFDFIRHNFHVYLDKLNPGDLGYLDLFSAPKYNKRQKKRAASGKKLLDPVMNEMSPVRALGSVSEYFENKLEDFAANNHKSIKDKHGEEVGIRKWKALMYLKYLTSLIHPGESVGVVAAQSVGEPSTQMTLNTFHLAGHGGANVTLGIPRLREIVMTASGAIKTPTMEFMLHGNAFDPEMASELASILSVLKLTDLVRSTRCTQFTTSENLVFSVRLDFNKRPEHVHWRAVQNTMERRFLPRLMSAVQDAISEAVMDVEVAKSKQAKKQNRLEEKELEEEISYDHQDEDSESDEEDEQSDLDEEEEALESDLESKSDGESTSDRESKMDVDADEDMLDRIKKIVEQKKQKRKRGKQRLPNYIHPFFAGIQYGRYDHDSDRRWVEIDVSLPKKSRRIFMLPLVKEVMSKVRVHSTRLINKCYVLEGRDPDTKRPLSRIQTDGVNFSAIWRYQNIIDVTTISSNDVSAILKTYGVEACRSAIITEINNVFGAYGISVDRRHLSLIADSMTFDGRYRAFSRSGVARHPSPFLKMSYETCTGFLATACLNGQYDHLRTPSARIVMGQVPKSGTGFFDLLQRVTERPVSEKVIVKKEKHSKKRSKKRSEKHKLKKRKA